MDYTKMDPEIKAQWIADLRSGNFKQGSGHLKVKYSDSEEFLYCCLGVLAERQLSEYFVPENYQYGCSYVCGTSSTGIPSDLIDKTTLDDNAQRPLARMNDRGVSFHSIADWIEENL